ncbi:MAG: N-acetylmuramoyl-L-alanine amidase [Coleofasciculaceae cyanobacterium]
MKFRSLLLFASFWSILLFAQAAEAARLLSWRFDENRNQLAFTTDDGVQPKAQLIFNPTRLVIDLPGTDLGRQTVNQSGRGGIREVRIGQFDSETTRIVVELRPGYTLNPQQVQFRGLSPNQWSVQLPEPERIVSSRPIPPPASKTLPTPPPLLSNDRPSGQQQETEANLPSSFQITRDGFFLRTEGGEPKNLRMRRSKDRRTIDFEVEGITFPASLAEQNLLVERYGVSQIQFSQGQNSSNLARISMSVSQDSPDWQASYSSVGGLVILPKGTTAAALDTTSGGWGGQQVSSGKSANSQLTTIESVELANNDTQLLIRANRDIRAETSWDSSAKAYRITIPSAQLADRVRGPQLGGSSPLARVLLRQQDSQTVVILVEPTRGTSIGALNQLGNQILALQLLPPRAAASPRQVTISVPPPERRTVTPPPTRVPPPRTNTPPVTRQRVPRGRVVVMIDPGHGGKDPGAIGIGGLREKDIVLPVSQRVAEILSRQGIQVVMTRGDDRFISLAGRVQMAERANANLFVSIHANAISLSRPDVNGVETYYYSSVGGRRLASSIQTSMLQRLNVRDRRVREARFYVIRRTSMPAVLVEVGFVTGREDAPRLASPTGRDQVAEAIAQGILNYLR